MVIWSTDTGDNNCRCTNYLQKKEKVIEVSGRHDPCIVPRAVPVVESMLGIVLTDYSILAGYIFRKIR